MLCFPTAVRQDERSHCRSPQCGLEPAKLCIDAVGPLTYGLKTTLSKTGVLVVLLGTAVLLLLLGTALLQLDAPISVQLMYHSNILSPASYPTKYGGSICEYGSLPGWWDSSRRTGSRWQLFDSRCQLRNLYEKYTHVPKEGHTSGSRHKQQWRVLFLGDSIDAFLMEDFCRATHGIYRQNDQPVDLHKPGALFHSHMAFNWCSAGPVVLGQIFLPSTSLDGPFKQRITDNWHTRIEQGLQTWRVVGKLLPPQLVVFSCNLWEVVRYTNPGRLIALPDGTSEFPEQLLTAYIANYTSMVRFTQGVVGQDDVRYAARTSVPNYLPGFGPHAFQAQLNAATRHVAATLGLHLFDQVPMVAQAANATSYTRDGFHPNADFNAENLNLYLNLLQQVTPLNGSP